MSQYARKNMIVLLPASVCTGFTIYYNCEKYYFVVKRAKQLRYVISWTSTFHINWLFLPYKTKKINRMYLIEKNCAEQNLKNIYFW